MMEKSSHFVVQLIVAIIDIIKVVFAFQVEVVTLVIMSLCNTSVILAIELVFVKFFFTTRIVIIAIDVIFLLLEECL